jgi:hypothetical protein
MYIKKLYSHFNPNTPNPNGRLPNTQIEYVSELEIKIDGKKFTFAPTDVAWDSYAVYKATGGLISEIKKIDGELYIIVSGFFDDSVPLPDHVPKFIKLGAV